MINHFTFNGTSTAQLGLIVSGVSIFGAGSRKVEKAGIPGRNGDLQIELGGFNNYTVRYTVSITNDFTTTAQQIREWLLESKGYCELTDTYHPDEIRKACFNSDIEFTTTMLYKYGQASIQFDCLPQRYIIRNTPITTTATEDTTTDTAMFLNTVPTPIKITLNGNTTQEGTPTPSTPQAIHNVSGDNTINVCRKNLLPNNQTTQTINGITFTINSDKSVSLSGTATALIDYYFIGASNQYVDIGLKTGTYNLSGCNGGAGTTYMLYCVLNRNGNLYYYQNFYAGGINVIVESGDTFRFFIRIMSGTTINTTIYPMLEVGSTATTYEPYTRQSYPLYLPVENLLPTFNATSGTSNGVTYSSDGSKIYLNGTSTAGVSIVFTVNGVLPSSEFYLCLFNNVINNNVAFVIDNGNTTVLSLSLGIETNRKQKYTTYYGETYTRVRVYINSAGQVFDNAVIMPMITYTPTVHYTPYGTTPIELNKIGTYQDYVYKNGGKWYVHKETRTLNLAVANMNNAENFPGWRNITETQLMKTDYPNQNTGLVAMTDYFTNVNTENTGVSINTQSSNSVIYLAGSGYTQTQWITNFSSLTIKLIYGLQSAENTEITDTTLINQLNNIEKAHSYNGITNILQVSNDNGFMLGVVSLHGSTFASSYKGEPIITANSTGLIYLNGEVMEVLSAPVTINCQTMQCYNGTVNMNNEVRVNDFPEIKIGTNEVGSSMALTITPNNWRH